MTDCQVRVNRGDSRVSDYGPCGRPAAGKDSKGRDACKLHLAADRRMIEGDARRAAIWKRDQELAGDAKRLSGILGVRVVAYFQVFGHPSRCTGDMVVPGAWLEEVARTGRVPTKPQAADPAKGGSP